MDRVSNVSSPEKKLKILGKFLKVLFGLFFIFCVVGVFFIFFFSPSLDPIFSRKMIPFSLFITFWTMLDFLPFPEKEILANNSDFILFCPRKPSFIWCHHHLQEHWARIELLPTTTVFQSDVTGGHCSDLSLPCSTFSTFYNNETGTICRWPTAVYSYWSPQSSTWLVFLLHLLYMCWYTVCRFSAMVFFRKQHFCKFRVIVMTVHTQS